MAPSRTLYSAQTLDIKINDVGNYLNLPVQSAACEMTRPTEDIMALGKLGNVTRVQKEPTTTKVDLRMFLPLPTASGVGTTYTLSGLDFNNLVNGAKSGIFTALRLGNIGTNTAGFDASGVLTSLSLEGSIGNFVELAMSFNALGEAVMGNPQTSTVGTDLNTTFTSYRPITTDLVLVGSGVAALCAQSARFSYDIPMEQLACLGGEITGTIKALTGDYLYVAKPPFKASMTFEGTAAQPNNSGIVTFGHVIVKIPNSTLSSQSVNQAVGSAGATYSFTVEGVEAEFLDNFAWVSDL
jgi:hypothetical protein